MIPDPLPNADGSAAPAAELRQVDVLFDGDLVKRLSPERAGEIVALGWGEWIGRGRRRHVRLTQDAPVSALRSGGCGNSGGTRPVTADRSCKIYGAGQRMGDSRSTREFVPPSF